MIKVSVIIPMFRVEKFISRCAVSLFEQTLQDVEFIFVDDASPDGSVELLQKVIEKYPQRENRITILTHLENKGLPSARNTGLAAAGGQYIFHCDSDDFVEPDMLERLYDEAARHDADIVWCDWFLTLSRNERYMPQPSFTDSKDAVRAMLSGGMKYNVWNKLVKRSLYDEYRIDFPSGYGMGEDLTMIMLFANAKKIHYYPKAFYHYVKTNSTAFSQTYSARHLSELRYNVDRIEKFIQGKFGNTLDKELSFMKLEAKFPFLLSEDPLKLQTWVEWYPEANTYIMQNKSLSLRSRLLQWCAANGYWTLVRCYNKLFNKVVYGLIYK